MQGGVCDREVQGCSVWNRLDLGDREMGNYHTELRDNCSTFCKGKREMEDRKRRGERGIVRVCLLQQLPTYTQREIRVWWMLANAITDERERGSERET